MRFAKNKKPNQKKISSYPIPPSFLIQHLWSLVIDIIIVFITTVSLSNCTTLLFFFFPKSNSNPDSSSSTSVRSFWTTMKSYLWNAYYSIRGGLSPSQFLLLLFTAACLIGANLFTLYYNITQYQYALAHPATNIRVDRFPLSSIPPIAVVLFNLIRLPPPTFVSLFSDYNCPNIYGANFTNPYRNDHCLHIPLPSALASQPPTLNTPIVIQSCVDCFTPYDYSPGTLAMDFLNPAVHYGSPNYTHVPGHNNILITAQIIVASPSLIGDLFSAVEQNPYGDLYYDSTLSDKVFPYIDESAVLDNWLPRNINGSNVYSQDSMDPNSFTYTFKGIQKLNQQTIYIPVLTPSSTFDNGHDISFAPQVSNFNHDMTIQVQEEILTFTWFNAISNWFAVFNLSLTVFTIMFPTIIFAKKERRWILDTEGEERQSTIGSQSEYKNLKSIHHSETMFFNEKIDVDSDLHHHSGNVTIKDNTDHEGRDFLSMNDLMANQQTNVNEDHHAVVINIDDHGHQHQKSSGESDESGSNEPERKVKAKTSTGSVGSESQLRKPNAVPTSMSSPSSSLSSKLLNRDDHATEYGSTEE